MRTLLLALITCFAAGALHARERITLQEPVPSLSSRYLSEDPSASPLLPRYHRQRALPYGDNVLTGSPVNLVVVNGYVCYGFGISYEHLFGPDRMLGIQVPMYCAFGANRWSDADDGHFFYTAPGLQVHVAGANHKVDYALGPSLILGNLWERFYYDNHSPVVHNQFTSGIMLDNNLNFYHRQFVFGLHLAFGTTFPNPDYSSRFFMQFGFRFGGRF